VGSDFGTLILSVPQAVAKAATAANALVMRMTLNGRLMRPEIIIGILMSGPLASKLCLVTICVTLLCGCSHTEVVGADRALHIALSEYRLNPQSVRVSAGVLNIYVHNFGRLTHNLVVSENGQSTFSTKPLWPGQSTELSLDLAPGNYSMASTILSDQALGAYGTLDVTP